MVNSRPSWPRLKEHDPHPVPQQDGDCPSNGLLRKLKRRTVQFLLPWCKENREVQGNEFPNEDRSHSTVLNSQMTGSKGKETSVSNQTGKFLTGDWSLDDRRRKALRCRSRHFFSRSSFCNAPIPRIRGRHCNVYT